MIFESWCARISHFWIPAWRESMKRIFPAWCRLMWPLVDTKLSAQVVLPWSTWAKIPGNHWGTSWCPEENGNEEVGKKQNAAVRTCRSCSSITQCKSVTFSQQRKLNKNVWHSQASSFVIQSGCCTQGTLQGCFLEAETGSSEIDLTCWMSACMTNQQIWVETTRVSWESRAIGSEQIYVEVAVRFDVLKTFKVQNQQSIVILQIRSLEIETTVPSSAACHCGMVWITTVDCQNVHCTPLL